MSFRLGLIINPVAGLGGSVALKGSDGPETTARALELGAQPRAAIRTGQALELLQGQDIRLLTWGGEMGENLARSLGFEPEVLGTTAEITTPEDTIQAATTLAQAGVDLLLFAGGDGTARNICDALEDRYPVLGIPAGVKIHSGVYAITPQAAGQIVLSLVRGELVTLQDREVRDIDEEAFRAGKVRARYYGELKVPSEHRYLQSVKNGTREDESLVLADIAADFIEQMDPDIRYIMGSGSTVAVIMEELGLPNTLLGVDVIENGELIASDCTARQLLELTEGHVSQLVITLIGGQGHIIGRGNQQISPELLRRFGRDALYIVATKTKLNQLEGRPMISDSGEPEVDKMLAGLMPVHTGYHDAVLYRVGY